MERVGARITREIWTQPECLGKQDCDCLDLRIIWFIDAILRATRLNGATPQAVLIRYCRDGACWCMHPPGNRGRYPNVLENQMGIACYIDAILIATRLNGARHRKRF
jgi:hypothetical protein